MIGNDRPEKQQDWGVRAFADSGGRGDLTVYTDRGDRVRAAWAGAAPQAVGSFSCVEGVRITPELLDEYAVMLHPSSHESASRAVIEARARGCFVVGFDVGDARRLLGADGGHLVPAGDLDALAVALRDALNASLSGALHQIPVPVRDPGTYTRELLELASPLRIVAARGPAGAGQERKSR
jgi:glycosyltransferase involved in cell wall biosynthesis